MSSTRFPATRTAALERLRTFVPRAGRAYAGSRNFDRPETGHPHVSGLSPYLRHRIVTEAEVLEAVLRRHSTDAAEKFVQEVFWRSYFKGWLELRPGTWADYRRALDGSLSEMAQDEDLARRVAEAEGGQTGIACFDAWARELVETGYLHNHARMWAASIWIFTLRLPWEIGADWFLRHLLDGDPASNTLGWRWVAGLQSRGKHYVARAENIARYTDGRFAPHGALNESPVPLAGPPHPAPRSAPAPQEMPTGRAGFLLTEEDLSPGWFIGACPEPPVGHAALLSVAGRSPRPVAEHVRTFTRGAVDDARARWGARFGDAGPMTEDVREIVDWARDRGLDHVVTPYAPVGPTASALRRLERMLNDESIDLVRLLRPWDAEVWRHATRGFYRFKERIPHFIHSFVDK